MDDDNFAFSFEFDDESADGFASAGPKRRNAAYVSRSEAGATQASPEVASGVEAFADARTTGVEVTDAEFKLGRDLPVLYKTGRPASDRRDKKAGRFAAKARDRLNASGVFDFTGDNVNEPMATGFGRPAQPHPDHESDASIDGDSAEPTLRWDDEAELDLSYLDDGEEELDEDGLPEEFEDAIALEGVALEARLHDHHRHHLINFDHALESDLRDLFSAMSGTVQPGEWLVVQHVNRDMSGWGEQQLQIVQAEKAGKPLTVPRWRVLHYYVKWLAVKFAGKPGSVLPANPKSPKGSNDRGDLSHHAGVTAKAKSAAHLAVDLRVALFGNRSRDLLQTKLNGFVEQAYGLFKNGAQHLVWEATDPRWVTSGQMRSVRDEHSLVLTERELANLFRLPSAATTTQSVVIEKLPFLQLPPQHPIVVQDPLAPPPGILPLFLVDKGTDTERIIGIENDQLDRQAYIFGGIGTGKSETLKWLTCGIAYHAARSDREPPLFIIDPQGPTARESVQALCQMMPEVLEDLLYIDLAQKEFVPRLNPLDVRKRSDVGPAVSRALSGLRHFRLTEKELVRGYHYTGLVLRALAEANLTITDPNAKCTLLHVMPFFRDDAFRREVVRCSGNFEVLSLFGPSGEWEGRSDKERQEIYNPIATRLGPITNNEDNPFARMFASPTDGLNWSHLLAAGKNIVLSLGGTEGADDQAAKFVGSLVLPDLYRNRSVFGRQQGLSNSGRGARIIIDEAPSLLADDEYVAKIIVELRKTNIALVLAGQFPSQFSATNLKAMTGNCGLQISLKVAGDEARKLISGIDEKNSHITKDDLSDLPNWAGYATVMQEITNPFTGDTSTESLPPFSFNTIPPIQRFDPAWNQLDPEAAREYERLITERVQEVIQRTHETCCNSSADMDARLEITPSSKADGTNRFAMVQMTYDYLLKQNAENARASVDSATPYDSEAAYGSVLAEHHAALDADSQSSDWASFKEVR